MTYITTWTDYICVIPPGNYDESTLTAALQTLIHGIEPYLIVSIDASSIMTIKINDYYKSFRIYTDSEVMKKINLVKYGVIDKANTSDPQYINENLCNTKVLPSVYAGKYPGNTTGNDTFTVNRLVLHPTNSVYLTSTN